MRHTKLLVVFLFVVSACSGSSGSDTGTAGPDGGDSLLATITVETQRAVQAARGLIDEFGPGAWQGLLLAFERGYTGEQVLESIDAGAPPDGDGWIGGDLVGAERPAGAPLGHLLLPEAEASRDWHPAQPGVLVRFSPAAPFAHGEPVPIGRVADGVADWARIAAERDSVVAVVVVARILRYLQSGYSTVQVIESVLLGGTTGSFYYGTGLEPVPADVIRFLATGQSVPAAPPDVEVHCEVLRGVSGVLVRPAAPSTAVAEACSDALDEHRELEGASGTASGGASEAAVFVGTANSFSQLDTNLIGGCQEFGNRMTLVLWSSRVATLAVEFTTQLNLTTRQCEPLTDPAVLRFIGFQDDTGHVTMRNYEIDVDVDLNEGGAAGIGEGFLGEEREGLQFEFEFQLRRCATLDVAAGPQPARAEGAPFLDASGC